MLVDAHCHPFDLITRNPNAEEERRNLGVFALSSACDLKEFEYCEKLSHNARAENAAGILPCFAVHPQHQVAGSREQAAGDKAALENSDNLLETLNILASENRIAAVGECGFDLFNAEFKATEAWQDKIFSAHLETARLFGFPLVIHARRAMHKIFARASALKKCKAAIFHSWPGTLEEGEALLRRGVNAYFSFGNTILRGHKQQARACAGLPADRLLTETDAPYQPKKGAEFSSYKDLPEIIKAIASLRNMNEQNMEKQIETNIRNIFNAELRKVTQSNN